MIPPFTSIFRGHCKIIHWPNLHVAVSHRGVRPEGGEREREWNVVRVSDQNNLEEEKLILAQFQKFSLSLTDSIDLSPK